MAIGSSGYFNNPQFAQAASNLQALFAPPSGSDAAGWATANAKKEEASRLAQLFSQGTTPSEQAALIGVQNYGQTPQGYTYGVDQDSATKRYGYDTAASTSRANNAADNQRSMLGTLYQPLNQGQIRPELPGSIAGQYGLPNVTVPQTAGAPKPLSETEFNAAILGTMAPELQQAAAFGSTPVETVQTPEGPKIATRLDAVGQTPYEKPAGPGMSVTLPDGTVVQQGGKPLTEAQSKDSVYFTRGSGALPLIDKYGDALLDLTGNAAGRVPIVGNYAKSPEYQLAEQAGDEFLQAILRKDTGAAITPSERAEYARVYLPLPGDQPETIAQKRLSRQRALAAIRIGLPPQAILALEQAGVDLNHSAVPPTVDPGAAPAPASGGTPDGTIIENDAGERMIRRNGAWEPYNG